MLTSAGRFVLRDVERKCVGEWSARGCAGSEQRLGAAAGHDCGAARQLQAGQVFSEDGPAEEDYGQGFEIGQGAEGGGGQAAQGRDGEGDGQEAGDQARGQEPEAVHGGDFGTGVQKEGQHDQGSDQELVKGAGHDRNVGPDAAVHEDEARVAEHGQGREAKARRMVRAVREIEPEFHHGREAEHGQADENPACGIQPLPHEKMCKD